MDWALKKVFFFVVQYNTIPKLIGKIGYEATSNIKTKNIYICTEEKSKQEQFNNLFGCLHLFLM